MSMLILTPHSGWPWPLDVVQDWFEGLWSSIEQWAYDAAKTVWSWIPDPLKNFIEFLKDLTRDVWNGLVAFFKDPVGALSKAFASLGQTIFDTLNAIGKLIGDAAGWTWDQIVGGINTLLEKLKEISNWVGERVGPIVGGIAEGLHDMMNWIWTKLTIIGEWITDKIMSYLGGILDWLTAVFKWLQSELGGTAEWIISGVTTAFDGAMATLMGVFEGWPTLLKDAFVGIAEGFGSFFDMAGVSALVFSSEQTYSEIVGLLKLSPIGESPLSMESAWKQLESVAEEGQVGWDRLAFGNIVLEAASLGQLDISFQQLFSSPKLKAAYERSSDFFNMEWEVGVYPLVRQVILSRFQPHIPPLSDLITMVVREAFLPEMVVKAPDIFAEYMLRTGYSREWSDRYWTAHFVPIALTQAYENLWRGYWTKERFMFALHIQDIHPMWREDIYKVAFGAPSIREMGYGYDTGEYSVEDIVKYRRWGGLSPEDAEKAGRAMVAYRTEAEREALRREAIADFEAWLDDEPQLRINLASIGGRPEIIDLWVERAKYRRTRDFILDMVKISVDQYIKGRITEDQLRQDLIDLGIVGEGRDKILAEAKTRRLKTVREEVAEQKKVMPESRVRQARDLGLISDGEYVRRLIDHDWTEEDAKLDLAIELTPRPVTPEEAERRRKTVTSKLARAKRRWEDRLARISAEIELTGLQREDSETIMSESLDVIDAQIRIIDDSIPLVTPDKAEELRNKRDLLVQRRELTEARLTARIRKLTEQLSDLTELKALMETHRDEELSEYEEELKLLEVAG